MRHCDSNRTVWVTLRIIIRVKIRDRTWVIGRLRDRIAVSFMWVYSQRQSLVVMAVLVSAGEFFAVGVLVAVGIPY